MAATTIDELQVIITAQNKQFQAALRDVSKQLDGVTGDTQKASSRMSAGFAAVGKAAKTGLTVGVVGAIAAVTASIPAAVKRVDTLNNASRTFENMGIDAGEAKKAMDNLNKSITGLPTPLDSAVRGMTALTATYGDVNKGQEVFSALNNAILGFGGSAAEVDNAIMQLSQLPMDGPLDSATWNSLRNSGLTPVIKAMADDMGMGVAKMKTAFGEGELKVEDFTEALVKMNKDGGGGMKSLEKIARDSTDGIGTGFANMRTSIVRGVAEVVKAIGSSKISAAISDIGKGFENTLRAIARVTPEIIRAVSDIGSQVGDYLGPKFSQLFTIIQTQLIPALKDFAENILLPLAAVLGTSLVVALGLTVDALSLFIQAATGLYGVLEPFIPAILALVAAYTAYQVISGIVAASQIALTGVMVAGTAANGAYAIGVGAVALAQQAAAAATTLWQGALSLMNPITLGLAAAVTAVVVAVEALKLSQMNANLEAQNTITFQERETQLRQMGRDAIAEQEAALRSYTDAKAEQTNASLALMNAEDQQTAATSRLDKMIRDGVDPASREYKRAQLELEAANDRVRAAQDKLSESSGVAKEKFDDVGNAVWAGIRAGKEDELQKLAQAGKYEEVNRKLRELATSTHEYKDANGNMTKMSGKDMEAMALTIGDSISKVNKDYRKFWDASQETVDKAAKNVDKVKADFERSGANFSQGLANGITNNAWRAESAAISTANRANAAFNKTLDIRSPSRVMERGGGYFSMGIAEGIKSKTKQVVAAAKKISSMAAHSADFSGAKGFDIPTTSQLSGRLDVAFAPSLASIDSRPTHVTVMVGEDTLVDKVVNGINNKSFMSNDVVIRV